MSATDGSSYGVVGVHCITGFRAQSVKPGTFGLDNHKNIVVI